MLDQKQSNEGNDDPRMHGCVIRFQKFVTCNMSKFSDAVQTVLMNETKKADIFSTKTTKERNEAYMLKHSKEYQHLVEGKYHSGAMAHLIR